MKKKMKTVAQRLFTLAMASVMAASMLAPVVAFADNKPSAGSETAGGVTRMYALNLNDEHGGTDEPEFFDDGTPNPYYNPAGENGLGVNIQFTVPSSLLFVINTDGSLICPTTATIDNESDTAVCVSSLKFDKASGWYPTTNAVSSSSANAIDITMAPANGTALDLFSVSGGKTALKDVMEKPYEWSMAAKDDTDYSNVKALSFTGHVNNLNVNTGVQQEFGKLYWYLKPITSYYQVPMQSAHAYFVYDENTKTARISSSDFDGAGTLMGGTSSGSKINSAVETIIVDDVIAPSSMQYWFYKLSKLDNLQGFEKINTTNVTGMNYMFSGCTSLTSLTGLAGWDTAKVMNMIYMFQNCKNLADLTGLANWNTAKVTNMIYMFNNCTNLTNLTGLANWNTAKVMNMGNMFNGCKNLADLSGLAGWNTANVTGMNYMFAECRKLTDLTPLASWNTAKVTNMSGMFQYCTSLNDLTGLASWNTAKVTNMSMMFYNCTKLSDLTPLEHWTVQSTATKTSMFDNIASDHTAYPSWYTE